MRGRRKAQGRVDGGVADRVRREYMGGRGQGQGAVDGESRAGPGGSAWGVTDRVSGSGWGVVGTRETDEDRR